MRLFATVLLIAFSLPLVEAWAQLQLPGASPQSPAGSHAGGTKPRESVSRAVPKGEETLPGRTLVYAGQAGALSFQRSGTAGQYAFTMVLSAVGRKSHDIRNACLHNFAARGAIALAATGRPNGLPRYQANVDGCMMAFDFLDDAAIASMPEGACMVNSDCAIDVTGLWGPPLAALPKEPEIERARAGAERRMNAARKLLQERYRHNPAAIKPFIAEQVSFPANRERQCRNYGGGEQGLGYCALKLTEARAAQLEAVVFGKK